MPEDQKQAKREKLKAQGNFNPHADQVSDPLFSEDGFFDPCDLLQVKYEMLRCVRKEGRSVVQAAADFGFSRRAYYQIKAAYEKGGLAGLQQKKRGPQRRHKLTEEVMDFLAGRIEAQGELKASALVLEVGQRFGLTVHQRTIEKALGSGKKK